MNRKAGLTALMSAFGRAFKTAVLTGAGQYVILGAGLDNIRHTGKRILKNAENEKAQGAECLVLFCRIDKI